MRPSLGSKCRHPPPRPPGGRRARRGGAWAAILAGRHSKRLREDFGLIGYVRAVEVTDGKAGWHPHLHVPLLTEAPLYLDELRDLHRFLRERWGRRIEAAGFREPALHRGVRLLPVGCADGVGGYLPGPDRTDRAVHQAGERPPIERLRFMCHHWLSAEERALLMVWLRRRVAAGKTIRPPLPGRA